MTCVPFFDAGCSFGNIVNGLTAGASSVALSGIAGAMRSALTWVIADFVPLWLKLPSPDLAGEPAVSAIGSWLLPISGAVAAGGMIVAAARMMLTRRAAPLMDIGAGLVTIAAVSALGVVLPDLLLTAGDSWTSWILRKSTGGNFDFRMGQILALGALPAVLIIIIGIIAIVMIVLQGVLLLFRQASIILLAAVLPLAAAGSIAPMTRNWLRKLIPWMLALILYKPAAAMVYAAAFTMIGQGRGIESVLMGVAMIVLSLVALPVLMRFFTWTTGSVGSTGGSGQFLGAAAAGAMALGTLRAGGALSASDHAEHLRQSTQPPAGGAGTAPGSGPAERGAGPGGSEPGPAGNASNRPSSGTAGSGASSGSGGTGTSTAPSADGPAAAPPSGTGTAAPSPAQGDGGATGGGTGGVRGRQHPAAAGAAAAGPAAATVAAFMAAQALAQGARDTAETVTNEGNRREQ